MKMEPKYKVIYKENGKVVSERGFNSFNSAVNYYNRSKGQKRRHTRPYNNNNWELILYNVTLNMAIARYDGEDAVLRYLNRRY